MTRITTIATALVLIALAPVRQAAAQDNTVRGALLDGAAGALADCDGPIGCRARTQVDPEQRRAEGPGILDVA